MNELGKCNRTHTDGSVDAHQSGLVCVPVQNMEHEPQEAIRTAEIHQAQLETEEQLRDEKKFLLSARTVMGSMPDSAFLAYCLRVSRYMSAFALFTERLTPEELSQLNI